MHMLSNTRRKDFIKNILIFSLASLSALLFYKLNEQHNKSQATTANVRSLTKTVVATRQITKEVQTAFLKILHERKLQHDTLTIIHDTSEISKRFENYRRYAKKMEVSLNDSLIKLSIRFLLVNSYTKKPDTDFIDHNIYKSIIGKDANVSVFPYRKSSRQSLFSPQKNFMRVYNKKPDGTVNGSPYFDYEELNDEMNFFSFQARSAYNFNSKAFSFGPGVELKLNRFGFNVAEFYNTTNKHFTTSLGTRVDIHRTRFK